MKGFSEWATVHLLVTGAQGWAEVYEDILLRGIKTRGSSVSDHGAVPSLASVGDGSPVGVLPLLRHKLLGSGSGVLCSEVRRIVAFFLPRQPYQQLDAAPLAPPSAVSKRAPGLTALVFALASAATVVCLLLLPISVRVRNAQPFCEPGWRGNLLCTPRW